MEAPQIDSKEILNPKSIGIAIGSGGVYSAAGLGVLSSLEKDGIKPEYVGGASGGAIIAALYFLEGDANIAKDKFIEKLPELQKIKLKASGKQIPGKDVEEIISNILDNRDWKDGKLKGLCVGASYVDTKEPIILTEESGLSLSECVLASTSLKMIEPIVELNGRKIAHGGDPEYLSGIKDIGADFVIEVSPNLQTGTIGKIAQLANEISSIFILRGDYFVPRRKTVSKSNFDFGIHPNLSLKPFIRPLDFSYKNAEFLIKQGEILTNSNIRKQIRNF